MRNYEAEVDAQMKQCGICKELPEQARKNQRRRSLRQILATQSRELTPLPPSAWPLGRPWK